MAEKITAPTSTPMLSADQFNQFLNGVLSRLGNDSAADAVLKLVEQQKRTVRQSNSYTDGISPFSYPEGDLARPKPKLDRETWFCGCRQDESMMKPEEIDAFNTLQVSKTWRGDPKFGVDVTPKRRFVMLPHVSVDERMNLPATLILACKELNEGTDAVKPEHMADQLLAMQAQLKTLEAEMAAVMNREATDLLAMAKQATSMDAIEFG